MKHQTLSSTTLTTSQSELVSPDATAMIGEISHLFVASWQQRGTAMYSSSDETADITAWSCAQEIGDNMDGNLLPINTQDKNQEASTRLVNKVGTVFIGEYLTGGLKINANEQAILAAKDLAAQVMRQQAGSTNFIPPQPSKKNINEISLSNLIAQPGIRSPLLQNHQHAPMNPRQAMKMKKDLYSPWQEITIKTKGGYIQFKFHVDILEAKGLNESIQVLAQGSFGRRSKSMPEIETYDKTQDGDISRITFKNRDAAKFFLKELHKIMAVPVSAMKWNAYSK